ncbi:hydrogen peroxide-inducible genes activator [Maribellus maritimus]|uniref:hydrogen peroxide-inducible genes activator n=1 Tax=Maribellus maritimus TaxID=2870838 RepID=UPI001EEB4C0D|nr:hydrogen peroxide-inducible genes activator [Maribellus maritimus]MCG6190422.1 hydrogen peroxide-inducible genes activator [Maribellus maritimus]
MNFTQLEYLKELYIQGSFSLAARHLKITQPALSLQIQKLEEEIGFTLLDRTKRPLQFTEEGKYFYHKSIDILKMVEELKQTSFELSEEVKGNVQVGIIPTLAPYLVPLFINELNRSYPDLQIEVTEFKTEDIISKLKLGDLDCGILSTPVSAGGVLFEALFYERFYAYISEDHQLFDRKKINIDELSEEEIWYLEEGNCFQNQVNSICKINYQKKTSQNLIYRSSSIESLRRIVENKNGITFLPELATINIPSELEELIKEFSGEQPVREISLVVSKNYSKKRQIAALKKVILDSIPQRMINQPESWVVDTLVQVK